MRPLAELQKLALTAVKYQDLIAIALYSHSPSMAYRVATELGWHDGKVASCRFLALILRDFGIEKFQDFVERKNLEARQELCWCECHREGGHDYFFDFGNECGCECCTHNVCLHAAHTFGYECKKCEADNKGNPRSCENCDGDDKGEGENRCETCNGNACPFCSCLACDPEECRSYQDGHCTGSACENCKCNDCEWAGKEKEQSVGTERREEGSEEGSEEVSKPVALPPGRVGRIAQRLFEVTERSYAVHVFESNEFRAYADGDSIVISTRAVNDCDDDELALVLSHELAHNLFEHSRESSERISSLLQWASRAVKYEGVLWGIVFGTLNYAVIRRADRNDELNADRAAVEIASPAGFDTSKAAKVFGQPRIRSGIFATHPSAECRARNIS